MHIHSLALSLSAGHVNSHTHTHTHICMLLCVCVCVCVCMGLPECIDKKGGGNNKRKGANSSLQPCHVRSIRQINPLLRRRWRSRADLCRSGTHDDMSNQISSSVCCPTWGLFRCARACVCVCIYHYICNLDPRHRLAPHIVHA